MRTAVVAALVSMRMESAQVSYAMDYAKEVAAYLNTLEMLGYRLNGEALDEIRIERGHPHPHVLTIGYSEDLRRWDVVES